MNVGKHNLQRNSETYLIGHYYATKKNTTKTNDPKKLRIIEQSKEESNEQVQKFTEGIRKCDQDIDYKMERNFVNLIE